jgi:pimeloyl-ACP methyl ester carboxylesterase
MGGETPTGATHPAARLHGRPVWVLLGILLVSTGCATPVGVTYGSTQDVYRTLTRSVLSAGKPSPLSEQTLLRLGLKERFETEPEEVLRQLRGDGTGLSRNLLFTLAELSFLQAEDRNRQDHYLAAAVYAYAFMVASRDEVAVALDPRARIAADIYNLGLTRGLSAPPSMVPAGTATAEADATQVIIEERTLELPFGRLELTVNPDNFLWSGYRFSRFVAVADFQVRGLLNRYRQAGLGAPLAADLVPIATGEEAERARRHIAPRTKVPVTAIVRLEDVWRGLATGRVRGQIELYTADGARTIELAGRAVPLELEPSAALAYQLEGAPVWETELRGFLSATLRLSPESLFTLHPYRPGRVPVVLVHGTASSPARWADLVNELQNDPALRERVQIWLFIYNTSNPILYSASELRRTLRDIVTELDPEGRDPALRQMVLIGHSQGGLLTRLMVTHSGNRFWENVSHVPFSEVRMSEETRALFARSMFFEPLPFVKRVVFVATPHHGSYRVSNLVLNVVRRLVTLPVTMTKGLQEVADAGAISMQTFRRMPTAVENMRPGDRFILALSSRPIADGVTAHSIVAVEGEGGPQGLSDGVVAYESAHIEGVASEKIVRSSHSTQGNPETILEIERILREHLGQPSTSKVDN